MEYINKCVLFRQILSRIYTLMAELQLEPVHPLDCAIKITTFTSITVYRVTDTKLYNSRNSNNHGI